ncbi:MAG: hypothetical protein LBU39_08850 [Desulfobulbaceae bacterium]|nr:hypothetical protein [Desulfobulbaceae bacterium]
MRYTVTIKKRVIKSIGKMPKMEQQALERLITDLEHDGPRQTRWRNYSRLGANEYHCHLSYHWVACWRHEAETIEIEVYYAGSRENAPY